MGVFKELIVDRRLNGRDLPSSVVVIAACNPAREKLVTLSAANARREELGKESAMGHYQVHPLPQSIEQVVWDYGALTSKQEEEFVQKRLAALYENSSVRFPRHEQIELAKLTCLSQVLTRRFAEERFRFLRERSIAEADAEGAPRPVVITDEEVKARASSVVSLRDIQRVFTFFSYFLRLLELRNSPQRGSADVDDSLYDLIFSDEDESPADRRKRAMLLTIGVVYFLRLSPEQRARFQDAKLFECRQQDCPPEDRFLMLPGSAAGSREHGGRRYELHSYFPQDFRLSNVLSECMEKLMSQTDPGEGIARTQGLQENVFMVVVCCFARVPLTIIGPPGSSKTLAVTVAAENAKGDQSEAMKFYRTQKRLIPFHYQCSRKSTSLEIETVFKRAIDKQKVDTSGTACFVFMDEAGLPEEQRESLKVLHYYLEDHVSKPVQVGFVAISNHPLDAAKANRCVSLLRAEPGHEELLQVAKGCLGTEQDRLLAQLVVGADKALPEVLAQLCEAYQDLMQEDGVERLGWFNTFFGLRDFMHFIKLLARQAEGSVVSVEKIVKALERNMNGVDEKDLKLLLSFWRSRLQASPSSTLRNPFDLLRESLLEQAQTRHKLLIDTTNDDSILRVLHERGDLSRNPSSSSCRGKLLKLSDFPEDSSLQQVTLVSNVKYAAEMGQTVILSQTEDVNESFYDLLNQHYQKMEDREVRVKLVLDVRDGEVKAMVQRVSVPVVTFHANIAVGSHSKLCKISPGFRCVVHLRLHELRAAPAPFLNRFEKYRLTHQDLLSSLLESTPALRKLTTKVSERISELVECIGSQSFYGQKPRQTIESVLLDLVSVHIVKSTTKSSDVAALQALQTLDGPVLAQARVELSDDADALHCLPGLCRRPSFVQQLALRFLGAEGNETQHREASSGESRAAVALLGQWLLQAAVRRLLQICTPERLYYHRSSIPADLLRTYFDDQARALTSYPHRLRRCYRTHSSLVREGTAALTVAYSLTHRVFRSTSVSSGFFASRFRMSVCINTLSSPVQAPQCLRCRHMACEQTLIPRRSGDASQNPILAPMMILTLQRA